jgi:hypothetical protein
MNQDLFDLLERTSLAEGPGAGLDLLIRKLLEEKRYQQIFEIRLLQKRHALGLPLIFSGSIADLPPEKRDVYQAAVTEAAREAGTSYLTDGDIVRAWPYFRAIGDPAPVAAAIEHVHSSEEVERVLAIALVDGVSLRKGFELLVEHRGICQGVDFVINCADRANRVMYLQILVRVFHGQLLAHLKEAVTVVEGATPATTRVREVITGRDWLFEGGRLYIENSHLLSILQASLELEDLDTMRLVLELAEYGQRLDPIYQNPAAPPFEDPFVDHAAYLRALLGENVEEAVAHFRKKLAASVPGSAQVLVGLLARLGRCAEAVQISLEQLGGEADDDCPSAVQLCQMAGDYQQLRDVARKKGDFLGFAAGILHGLPAELRHKVTS